MFALALWDAKERLLQLARDRFGEKPLYYGWVGGDFVFASELKALRLHPRFDNRIDRRALQLFAARTYVPAPLSIYRRHLQARARLHPDRVGRGSADAQSHRRCSRVVGPGLKIERYWSYRDASRRAWPIRSQTRRQRSKRWKRLCPQAVMGQSMADVPVGAFLSGGIDCSTIVALYQKYSSQPVRTFSIGFEEPAYTRPGCQGGRRPSRHRASRTLCHRARSAGRHSRCCRPCMTSRSPIPRRSRPTRSAVRAERGHGRADGRRRRRAVRRL